MNYELFSKLSGNMFRLVPPHGDPFEAELILVSSLPNRLSLPRDPFSLIFRAPRTLRLVQQTYRVQHEQVTAEIFLVPIGPDNHGMRLEAVFN